MEIRDLRNISNSLHELGAVIQKHDPHYHRTSLKAYTFLPSSVHTRYKRVATTSLRNKKSLGLSRNPPLSVQPLAAKTHHEPRIQFKTSRPTHNLFFRLRPGQTRGPSLHFFLPYICTHFLPPHWVVHASFSMLFIYTLDVTWWRTKTMKLRFKWLSTATCYLPFRVPTHSSWRFVLKRPILSQLNWTILLCDVLPDGKTE
jgi:hypothetical protein